MDNFQLAMLCDPHPSTVMHPRARLWAPCGELRHSPARVPAPGVFLASLLHRYFEALQGVSISYRTCVLGIQASQMSC